MRPFRSLKSIAPALVIGGVLMGCSNTKTSWEAMGDYQTQLTIADTMTTAIGTVYKTGGPQFESKVDMCDVKDVTWGFGFSTIHNGDVAAVRTPLPQALCVKGIHTIASGTVLTYQPVGSDTMTLRAQPATAWTVTGSVTVTEYTEFNPREPKVNERLLSETSKGTFSLEAHGPNGELVRFQNGTYQFDIYVRKDPYNPFD